MKKILEIFQDHTGQMSFMRIASGVLLLFFIAFNFWYTNKYGKVEGDFILYNSLLLIAIFVPKYLQKIAEYKFGKIEETKQPEVINPQPQVQ